MTWLRATDVGVTLELLVAPRASRSRIVGAHAGRLKVQLAAPPVDGEANAALVELIAKTLGCPRQAVRVASGETSRRKRVEVDGVSAETARGALDAC